MGPVEMPELAPDEVLVAVMASSINYNTVWSAMFEPLPTFNFLARMGKQGGLRRGMTGRITWWVPTVRVWWCGQVPAYGAGRPATTSS